MSALGHKRTFAVPHPCPLYPRKRTLIAGSRNVGFVPKADIRLSERAYSGARALRSGMSEILIRPLNGSFISKIK